MKKEAITEAVRQSLKEDVRTGDITAELIPMETQAIAQIKSRESAIICGIPWVNEVYHQLDDSIDIHWLVQDGDSVVPEQSLVELHGSARSLITGERCALNWLQTLSGTATLVSSYMPHLENTHTQLLDTRKTLPGLRVAQKYAVRVGGGTNHRMGLDDAYLIKENHIISCGSIEAAIVSARSLHPTQTVEVEVENLNELDEAISAGADIIMLDNFDLKQMHEAVLINKGRVKLEVSGDVKPEQLRQIAETGVDYISMGSLTKHVRAIDLSMRFVRRMQR